MHELGPHRERLALALAGSLVAAAAGCLDPTQIELSLHTDVPHKSGRTVTITAAAPAEVENHELNTIATGTWSDDGRIGTIVLVPSGDKNAEVAVRVVLGVARDPSLCTIADPDGCIFARRKLRYIEHTPLELPVTLHAACLGKPCDESSTCNALGDCVPSEVDGELCGEPGQCMVPGDSLPQVTPVPPTADVRAAAAGWRHSCALLIDNEVRCWGLADAGQLGNGSTLTIGDGPGEMGEALITARLGVGQSAVALRVGMRHSCAVLDDGSAKCWGDNADGQLGLGDQTARGGVPGSMGEALPIVELAMDAPVVDLALGFNFTCARLFDGHVRCWGNNEFGQLGQGDTENRGDEPGEMGELLRPLDLAGGSRVSHIAAGSRHGCALLETGALLCWGNNEYGQLGQGTTEHVGDEQGEIGAAMARIPIATGVPIAQLSLGAYFSCARFIDGRVKCWGQNDSGQLGQEDREDRGDQPGELDGALPFIDLGAGRTATTIAAGGNQCCAILDDRTLKCWGENADGQLGRGDAADRGDEPGEMGDELLPVDLGLGDAVTQVDVGVDHVCAVVDARIKCWGINESGVLGLGDLESRGDGPLEMGVNLPVVDIGL